MKAYERFLNYARISTASDEAGESHVPSTQRQFDLAKLLVQELKALGVEDAFVDGHCYVYGSLPGTEGYEKAPKLGFIAHMDTSPDVSGEDVKPQFVYEYDGGDIVLGSSGLVISPETFPHLSRLKGRTLITTDGSTLLGADDKAGIAEIMTLIEELQDNKLPHGPLGFAFTPDEEIGNGPAFFDVKGFGCAFAYTVDGGEEGEIEYENFNAASASFAVKGFSVHPGTSKDTMKNASLIAMEINAMLPGGDIPAKTEGYEGFFHLTGMEGDVSNAQLHYIIRDHDLSKLEARKDCLKHIEKCINEKYGQGSCVLKLKDNYRNMKEIIEQNYHLIENALTACKESGISPTVVPIRGGTDGARLSFMGLPCPNLGTGGFAFHGPYEHISIEGMDKAVLMLHRLVEIYSRF